MWVFQPGEVLTWCSYYFDGISLTISGRCLCVTLTGSCSLHLLFSIHTNSLSLFWATSSWGWSDKSTSGSITTITALEQTWSQHSTGVSPQTCVNHSLATAYVHSKPWGFTISRWQKQRGLWFSLQINEVPQDLGRSWSAIKKSGFRVQDYLVFYCTAAEITLKLQDADLFTLSSPFQRQWSLNP